MNRPFNIESARGRGFGIGELLALLAVGSLGAVLVLIPLAISRQRSRLAQCTHNLQRVNQSVIAYAENHQGKFPGVDDPVPGELQWWYKELVKPYLKDATTDVFACPEDRGYTDPVPFCKSERFDNTSYNFNGILVPGAPNIAGWSVAAIADPKQTLLTMEWTAHGPLSWHRSQTGRKNFPFYSDAESVVGFVDGHVNFSKIYYDGHTPAYMRDPIPGYDYRYSGN